MAMMAGTEYWVSNLRMLCVLNAVVEVVGCDISYSLCTVILIIYRSLFTVQI